MSEVLPVIFFGHGNPMNAVQNNRYTEGWRRIGKQTRKPKAILSISAHWFVPGTGVTISTPPKTIHDFGGFPRELYQVQYPAPGDPDLAAVCNSCWRQCRCNWTTPGDSITEHGPCSVTFIQMPMFPWCS
jgi:aromatic ring-opening dioxygenase catalytic subunit (LigB family)